jgi:hypothetical protein
MVIRQIYTFLAGLFLLIFIGTGIAAAYHEPNEPSPPSWYTSETATPNRFSHRQQIAYNAQLRQYQHNRDSYNRNASIAILICSIAILFMATQWRPKLSHIADGLFLGGLFTLLYGVGRGMSAGNDWCRFVAATLGFGSVVWFGYRRFSQPVIAPSAKPRRSQKKQAKR